MRIVLDTNVLVSALLSPDGSPARVLALAVAGRVDLLVDDRILAEYDRVLRRAKFGMEPSDVAEFIHRLERIAEYVAAVPVAPGLPDPDDTKFLECAAAGLADCIVTGNARHFPRKASREVRVLAPAEFLSLYAEPPEDT